MSPPRRRPPVCGRQARRIAERRLVGVDWRRAAIERTAPTCRVIEIRVATEDDWRAMSRVDMQAFGYTMTQEEEDRGRWAIDWDRFRLAVDGADIVGVAGSWPLQMTLP